MEEEEDEPQPAPPVAPIDRAIEKLQAQMAVHAPFADQDRENPQERQAQRRAQQPARNMNRQEEQFIEVISLAQVFSFLFIQMLLRCSLPRCIFPLQALICLNLFSDDGFV